MGKFVKSVCLFMGLSLVIGFTTVYSAAELWPNKMPHSTVLLASTVDFVKLSGSIRQVDSESDDVILIKGLVSQLYSHQRRKLVQFDDESWTYIVINGDKARYLMRKSHAFAWTDFANKVVVLLDIPGANRWAVMAHEFTHVMQAEDGRSIWTEDRVYLEYQAEVNARTIMGVLENHPFPRSVDTVKFSFYERVMIVKYLKHNGF